MGELKKSHLESILDYHLFKVWILDLRLLNIHKFGVFCTDTGLEAFYKRKKKLSKHGSQQAQPFTSLIELLSNPDPFHIR